MPSRPDPVRMVVRSWAERPWVTWSAVEVQKMAEAPLRLKMDDIIFIPDREVAGGAAVSRRRGGRDLDYEEGGVEVERIWIEGEHG